MNIVIKKMETDAEIKGKAYEHESEYNYESAHDSSDEDQTQEMSM